MSRSIPELLLRVAALFDDLGIPYVVGGSFASSMMGEPRATQDVDVAVRLDADALERLIASAGDEFYVAARAAREALSSTEPMPSFNMLDQLGPAKVDVFVLGHGLLDRLQIARRVAVSMSDGSSIWVTAPAEIVLRKLSWFAVGGGTSDRQWRDVCGVLSANLSSIDLVDLRATAAELDLGELLDEALAQAAD